MKDLNVREKLKQNKRQGQTWPYQNISFWLWDRANRLREKRREEKIREEEEGRRKKEEGRRKREGKAKVWNLHMFGLSMETIV